MWTIDGEVFGNAVGASVVLPDGAKSFGTGFMQLGIDDVHAGASSIEPRLAMMDELGIYAQIVYPNVVGFGGQRFVDVVDPDAQGALRDDLQRRHGRVPGRRPGSACSRWRCCRGGTSTPRSPRWRGRTRSGCGA